MGIWFRVREFGGLRVSNFEVLCLFWGFGSGAAYP